MAPSHKPERPDLPILPRSEFRTREKIWPQAIADGIARIDAFATDHVTKAWPSGAERRQVSEPHR